MTKIKMNNIFLINNIPKLYKKLLFLVFIEVFFLFVGAAGFKILQPEHSFVDSFYMSIITLSTVGFGEVYVLNANARIFTMFLIVLGIVIIGYGITAILSIIIEGELKNTIKESKMRKKIAKLNDHIIICGYGRLGETAAQELLQMKYPFVIVEKDAEKIEVLRDNNVLCVHGNSENDSILIDAGIERASGFISALNQDSDNLFATVTARALNPNLTIISRAEYSKSEPKLISAGADRVLSPLKNAGKRMVSMLLNPEVVDFIDTVVNSTDLDLTMREIHLSVDSHLSNKMIKDSNLPSELKIIGIKRGDTKIKVNPKASFILKGEDHLIVLGETKVIEKLKSENFF